MFKIFVDFEMQPIYDRTARHICQNEIIEIGAVMLDDDLKEASVFKCFVKPSYTDHLSKKIIDLTGITDGRLAGAGSFGTAIEEFATWGCSTAEEVQIYSWSETDSDQVNREIRLKGIEPSEKLRKLLTSWFDYQKAFDDLAKSEQPISLDHALAICGMAFDGKRHDALYDAKNTAELYRRTQDPKEYGEIIHVIRTYIHKQEKPVLMGDLIDFESLKNAIA